MHYAPLQHLFLSSTPAPVLVFPWSHFHSLFQLLVNWIKENMIIRIVYYKQHRLQKMETSSMTRRYLIMLSLIILVLYQVTTTTHASVTSPLPLPSPSPSSSMAQVLHVIFPIRIRIDVESFSICILRKIQYARIRAFIYARLISFGKCTRASLNVHPCYYDGEKKQKTLIGKT